MRDMAVKGRHGVAILTAEDVEKIRLDPRISREVALDYGVSAAAIRDARRRHWAHVLTPDAYRQKLTESDVTRIVADNRVSRLVAKDFGISGAYVRLLKARARRASRQIDIPSIHST